MTKRMFHGTSHEAYMSILDTGFITDIKCDSHEMSVWLTPDIEIAKKFAERSIWNNKIPTVLVINTEQMEQDGFSFWHFSEYAYLTDDVPTKYIMEEIKI